VTADILEMSWREMEKFSWASRVKNEALQRVKKEAITLQTIKRMEATWIAYINIS
jgi:hypothetical protein